MHSVVGIRRGSSSHQREGQYYPSTVKGCTYNRYRSNGENSKSGARKMVDHCHLDKSNIDDGDEDDDRPSNCNTPNKPRCFGEEIDANNIDPMNNSFASLESKDTALSSVTMDDQHSVSESDCGTEASSVAALRTWLDDFGKQSKTHYGKTSSIGRAPEGVELEKPVRPKVAKSAGPTPLPAAAANALAKRLVDPRELPKKTTGGLPGQPPRKNTHGTPIRLKPKFNRDDVQATNEGYAPVKVLSAWLADDPTKTKKVKHIRRGANVIAKSRKFDKGMEDVIIEQSRIRTGSVAARRSLLEPPVVTNDASEDEISLCSANGRIKTDWPVPEADAASSISVSDKKKWLAGAFKKDGDEGDHSNMRRAKTDLMTSKDMRDDVSSRAKEMWRSRLPTSKTAIAKPSTNAVTKDERDEKQPQSRVEEDKTPVDFHSAREKLVQRSKANGNSVDVTNKVQLRKAKFEKIERDNRRMSQPHGHLRASWSDDSDGPSSSYIKKYVSDVAPKKSFEDLP